MSIEKNSTNCLSIVCYVKKIFLKLFFKYAKRCYFPNMYGKAIP